MWTFQMKTEAELTIETLQIKLTPNKSLDIDQSRSKHFGLETNLFYRRKSNPDSSIVQIVA